jgi:hypothetical protein
MSLEDIPSWIIAISVFIMAVSLAVFIFATIKGWV